MSRGRKQNCPRCGNCEKYNKFENVGGKGRARGFCALEQIKVHPMQAQCVGWTQRERRFTIEL